MVDPEDFVKDQLPMGRWPVIATVLQSAYSAARDLAKDHPILQVESAADNHGRLVAWAVDFGLRRAVESGAIDCDYRWRSFAHPTGRYLELRFSHSTASVSQVAFPTKQPRNVVFRENARLKNQPTFDLPEFRDDQKVLGMPHFLLVHGHQELNFAHFGVPSARSPRDWSWLSRNIMAMPHEIVSDLAPPEETDTDFDELNLLKEEIEKWRREHGEQ